MSFSAIMVSSTIWLIAGRAVSPLRSATLRKYFFIVGTRESPVR